MSNNKLVKIGARHLMAPGLWSRWYVAIAFPLSPEVAAKVERDLVKNHPEMEFKIMSKAEALGVTV